MSQPPSIKFLVDESIEFRIAEFLREKNFDTLAITEDFPSISDIEVLNLAYKQKRVLITNDLGFGQLVFKEKQKSCGVILIRMPKSKVEEKIHKLRFILKSKLTQLPNLFISVTGKRTRSKLLPSN